VQLAQGDALAFGGESLRCLATPGHTAGSLSYLWRGHVFTGDALLINGCGRTDFQSGNARQLYHSITQVLFSLPPETTVWPGHDYHGRSHSTIAAEKAGNARVAGRSKFNFWRLWNLALEGITSFSTAPLRLATYLGLVTAALAFAFALKVVLKALLFGDPVQGWPTMMAVILFLGGVQLIALGLIGEYLGRLYEESKRRPLYLVDTWQPAAGVSSGRKAISTFPTFAEGDGRAHSQTVVGGEDR